MARPGNGKAAIFYDVDNQRFMGWKQGYVDFLMQVLNPIRDKEGALFTFQDGNGLGVHGEYPLFQRAGIRDIAGCRGETLYLRDQYVG